MIKLKGKTPRLWRGVVENEFHQTIYGTKTLTSFVCKVCKKIGFLAEAYKESPKNRKHANHVRPYHADCYLATNGRVRPKVENTTPSLEEPSNA